QDASSKPLFLGRDALPEPPCSNRYTVTVGSSCSSLSTACTVAWSVEPSSTMTISIWSKMLDRRSDAMHLCNRCGPLLYVGTTTDSIAGFFGDILGVTSMLSKRRDTPISSM